MIRELLKELHGILSRLDQYDRLAKTPVRIPTTATEAARLCDSVLDHANLATVTTTEIALATYLSAVLKTTRVVAATPAGCEIRLSDRTIAKFTALPLTVAAPLPMAVAIRFTNGSSLQFHASSQLSFREVDGSVWSFPYLPMTPPSTAEIDHVIAIGVDASDKPRSGG